MKLKTLFFLLLFIFIFGTSQQVQASGNVYGWAWSDNIGWISFNCYNDYDGDGTLEDNCLTSNFGVSISTSTGKFSGYAWSDNIGWISFERDYTKAPPQGDPCPDGTCIAKVDDLSNIGKSNVEVLGWARALSACPSETGGDPTDPFDDPCESTDENVGGWTGWIRFDHGQSNEVYIDENGNFHNFAWGSEVVGWVSFNCEEGGPNGENICSNSNYKVFLDILSFNQSPTVSPVRVTWDDCTFKGISIPTFHWTYSDPDGDPMGGYEIEIQGEEGNTFFASSTGPSTAYTLQDTTWIKNNLLFGKTYSWRIRVKDNKEAWSDWSEENFSTRSHAYPWVNFNWAPQKPSLNEIVQFCSRSTGTCSTIINSNDESECYAPPCHFEWSFENASPTFSTITNPTTTFISPQKSTTTLTIRDSDGYSCLKSKTIQITFPLPKWREIPPVSLLEKEFRKLTQITDFVKIHLTKFLEKLKLKL